MVATELITGMEELVNHIRELEAEIKTLKELCIGMCQQLEDATEHEVKDPDHYYRGIQAVKELKEENKKLKEELENSRIVRFSVSEMRQELKEENKKLKEELDDKDHWQQTMVSYMDDRDEWCQFDRWFRENIDEDDKKQEWVKIWMENTEYDSDDEDSDDVIETEPESDKP